MIEMPEAYVISHQMDETLSGKTIQRFARGPLVHKFLWLNRPEEEMHRMMAGQTVKGASSYGRSMYLRLGDAYMLWMGEMGGRWLYHPAGQAGPEKYHVRLDFTDGSALTYLMQMWGFINLLEQAEFNERPRKEVGIPPLSEAFTFERFDQMLEAYPDKAKKGVKGFLVTSQHVNGIGNSYLQDILFQARLHPARKIPTLTAEERGRLHTAIQSVMLAAISLGGREDERDLFNQPGGYERVMDSHAAGQHCPVCHNTVERIAYLGGACYICPQCQPR